MSQKYLNIRKHRTFLNEKSPMSTFLCQRFCDIHCQLLLVNIFSVIQNFVSVKLEISTGRIMNFDSWHEKKEWLTENLWPKFHDIEFRNFVTVTKFLLTFNVGHEIFLDRHDFFWNPVWYMRVVKISKTAPLVVKISKTAPPLVVENSKTAPPLSRRNFKNSPP